MRQFDGKREWWTFRTHLHSFLCEKKTEPFDSKPFTKENEKREKFTRTERSKNQRSADFRIRFAFTGRPSHAPNRVHKTATQFLEVQLFSLSVRLQSPVDLKDVILQAARGHRQVHTESLLHWFCDGHFRWVLVLGWHWCLIGAGAWHSMLMKPIFVYGLIQDFDFRCGTHRSSQEATNLAAK